MFCDAPPSKRSSANSHIYLPHFIPAAASMAQRAIFSSPASSSPADVTAPAGVALVLAAACLLLFATRLTRQRAAARHAAVGLV